MAAVRPTSISTHMPYLAKDKLYETEKPYGADFPVDQYVGSRSSNWLFDDQKILVHDIRGLDPPTLAKNGFCFLKVKTTLKEDEATNEQTPAMKQFLQEIEKTLYRQFPEYSRIELTDFQVRLRQLHSRYYRLSLIFLAS